MAAIQHSFQRTRGMQGKRVRATIAVLAALALELTAPVGRADEKATDRPADFAIVNARIWTGVKSPMGRRSLRVEPTALAVADGTIVAMGNDESVRPRIGDNTVVIDAAGRRVIPGMTDSHIHLVGGGFQLGRLALRDVGSRGEFIRAVEAAAKTKAAGEWILGGRWSTESWDDPQTPHRSWVDPVTGNRPLLLTRMDGHQALANSAALRLAGIDAAGPADPVGGEIVRDPATGEPTGILKESAADLVDDLVPEPSPTQRYEALRRAMRHANSMGITSVHSMCEPADLEAFRRAYIAGILTVRITAYLETDDWPGHLEQVANFDLSNEMIRLAGLKGYMDGSLGSRTAYMREPYSDAAPQTVYPRGQLTAFATSGGLFEEQVAMVQARGLQTAVHAIGDQANHLLLNAYEKAAKRTGRGDARHRIEHAQHLLVSDIPRFAKLGVVASMQPFHKADDGRYAEKPLGPKRLEGAYAYRRLLDTGALVCFGSDWPVVTLNPFAGIDAAVNARTLADKVWLSSHSTTLEEALYAYTLSPARAVHRETRLGTLEVGKLADMVILADDLLTMPLDRIGETRVVQTIVGGKVVYTRPE